MRRGEGGFTLLEVLVATVILGVAITGLLSSLSTSLRTASRITDIDRAATLARRKMDEILVDRNFPRGSTVEGVWDRPGEVTGGWRARVTQYEAPRELKEGVFVLDRVELEVWWMSGSERRTFQVEGFRTVLLRPAQGGG
jgi:prepilin-type N-terminal cleavage/methylation domain-containing protein